MTQKKCPLCSRLSSRLKKLFRRFYPIGIDCQGINLRADGDQRVTTINAEAPDCACEKFRMSKDSSGIIEDAEQLVQFVFLPRHKNYIGKNGRAKPSMFSHINAKGRSIQRQDVAQPTELATWLQTNLTKNSEAWDGVLLAKSGDLRGIEIGETSRRALCIYDTAEKENPAHGEICRTEHIIEEADNNEFRANLLKAFGDGEIIDRVIYQQGAIWNSLPHDLQSRAR